MDYEEAIKQDVQALLLTDKVKVSVEELPDNKIMFSIVIGEGKKGGLFFSGTVDKEGIATSIDNCIMMLRSQLVLYAIECINKGYQAPFDGVFIPERTHTVLFPTNDDANNYARSLSSIVSSFNMFQDSYFGGAKIPSVAKTKSIKKTKTK